LSKIETILLELYPDERKEIFPAINELFEKAIVYDAEDSEIHDWMWYSKDDFEWGNMLDCLLNYKTSKK